MRTSVYVIEIHSNRFSWIFAVTQFLNFENPSIFNKVMAILSFKKFPKITDFCKSCYPLWHFESQGLYLARYYWMKKRLFKVHTYTEYRVFTGLKYLILYGCNAYPKSDHEIASVDATVYERVKKSSLVASKGLI